MRPQAVCPPDPLHRADAEPAGRGQRRRRPVGHAVRRRLCQRAGHDPLDDGLGQRRDACRPRLVAQQAVHAVGHEPLLPAPHGRFRHAGPAHHLRSAAALRARQNDPGPPHVLVRAVAVRHDRREPRPIGRGHVDLDSLAHDASLPPALRKGNLSLDLIH